MTRQPASLGGPLDDRQIVGILASIGQGEIDMALVAVERAQFPQTRAFAEQLIVQDSQASRAVQEITGLAPSPSPELNELTKGLIANLERMRVAQGAILDITYVCETIGGQLALLQLFDTRLVPEAADDPQLAALVAQGRAFIVAKQAPAQALLTFLGGEFDLKGPSGFRCGIGLPQLP